MPYTPPTTSPALSPSKSLNVFYDYRKKDSDKVLQDEKVIEIDNSTSRDSALKEVYDILSTSPQFSTSPRRKSAPESFLKRPTSLKVDLPLPLSKEEIPCLIRKKSGEIVKSSLKSKSEPPTPTAAFPKYVHFNADLEQIKLFNEAQRPQAVSTEVSDDDDSDDDDFDFLPDDDEEEDLRDPDPELTIYLPNRPIMTTLHSSKPVFVENVFLSRDKKTLQGRIMVQNIAFQKSVHVRYTFDFWSNVSEVPATFAEGVPSKDNKNSFDLFVFSIDLIDNSRNPIDGKTMYFAVHYHVEDSDYWDNNDGSNFQVNFKRVAQPSTPKKSKSQNVTSKWSMSSINRPSKEHIDESLCRSPPTLIDTTDPRKKLLGRYDIGVSLSAAQNAPRSILPSDNTFAYQTYFPPKMSYGSDNYNLYFPNHYIDGMPSELASSPITNPVAIPTSRPAMGSNSYCDFLKQYCFYSTPPAIFASPS